MYFFIEFICGLRCTEFVPARAKAGTEIARPRRINRIQAVTFFTSSP
jgi:hypothetical protein